MRILFILVKVNEIVKYKNSQTFGDLVGIVKTIHGRKWLTVVWSDSIIIREHADDLVFTGRVHEGKNANRKIFFTQIKKILDNQEDS